MGDIMRVAEGHGRPLLGFGYPVLLFYIFIYLCLPDSLYFLKHNTDKNKNKRKIRLRRTTPQPDSSSWRELMHATILWSTAITIGDDRYADTSREPRGERR
jgi:hypothetical protein